jgi:AraC family transcriptional regulator
MKVMVIVKASQASEAGQLPSRQLLTEMGDFNKTLVDAGVMLAGEGLHPSSKGRRVKFSGKNRTVTDGPFAETKELIAGFWLWNVKSIDEAVAWVKRCPNPHEEECEIEIRQVFGVDDFGENLTPELREKEAGLRAQTLGLGSLRFEQGRDRLIAGLNQSYTAQSRANIPTQWQRFAPHIGKLPGQIGRASYGVSWNTKPDCSFDYLTGVEVTDSASLPPEFKRLTLPARRYAVFTHEAHVSTLPQTIDTIWARWVPESGLKAASAPCFERYSEEFNPQTGRGGMEVWVPLDA